MADWIFPGNPRHYDLDASVAASREQWWGTPRYRVDDRISPPLLRSELLEDVQLGSFRPFRGFQGSNVPVPPDVAAALAGRAAPRLEPLPRENR